MDFNVLSTSEKQKKKKNDDKEEEENTKKAKFTREEDSIPADVDGDGSNR